MVLARNAAWNETLRMNASIAFARRFVAIALGQSLHDPKGGVLRE
jgi:hypothetical protein